MKVKHLIEKLKQCDPELPVSTEGCDCWGDTVCVIRHPDLILIGRSDYRKWASTDNSQDGRIFDESDEDNQK